MNDHIQRRRAVNRLIEDKAVLDGMTPEEIRRYSGGRATRYDRREYDKPRSGDEL